MAKKTKSKKATPQAVAINSRKDLRLSLKGKTPKERTQLVRAHAQQLKAARRAKVAITE